MLKKMLCGMALVLAAGVTCVFAAPAADSTTLFDFEDNADVAKWQIEDQLKAIVTLACSTEHATSGKHSLQMSLKPHAWPGMFTEAVPKDWSGYAELSFDVFAAVDTALNVRIDDEASTDYNSRFNSQALDVSKGANTVTVTLGDVGDAVDLKKIKRLVIFSGDVPEDRVFFIDNVRLVKKK